MEFQERIKNFIDRFPKEPNDILIGNFTASFKYSNSHGDLELIMTKDEDTITVLTGTHHHKVEDVSEYDAIKLVREFLYPIS